jgi:hypothetical protein
MPILTAKQVWKKPVDARSRVKVLNRLDPVEEERVRHAMEFLRLRYGNWTGVAKAMGYHRVTIERVLNLRRTATAAFALRVAKQLGVTLGDVLSGARPKAGDCPMCGAR